MRDAIDRRRDLHAHGGESARVATDARSLPPGPFWAETVQDALERLLHDDDRQPLEDVREVCNYLDALKYARGQLASPKGLPLSMRLLHEAHRRLMRGVRGANKQPGAVRRSQNWIGGTRPGTELEER